MLLTYKNLAIRTATRQDAPLLCRWWNDGKVMAHAGMPNGLGTNVDEIRKGLSAEPGVRLMIEIDDTPVGEMACRDKGDKAVELGIKICDFEKQEQGYGTLFLKMLISEMFRRGYERILLSTNLNNDRARYVYEKKLGFKMVRVDCDSLKDQLGVWQSFAHYELQKDWFTPLV